MLFCFSAIFLRKHNRMASIEDLYHNCTILADAKEKAGQHIAEYKVIMSGISSGPSEKRLASQFIARFFRHFPALADDSLDAIFDLCEDEDASVRKQAIRDLPQLCRDSVEYSQRAACILLQLAAAVNATEQSAIYVSLVSILRANMKGTLEHIFELMTPTEDVMRHQCIVFLHAKLKVFLSDDNVKEIEEIIVQNCKKVIDEVSGDECLLLVQMLKFLPSMSALTGRQYLLDVISKHVNFDVAVKSGDAERLFQALQFIKETAGLFSKNVPSTNFVKYFCLHILPKVNTDDDGKDVDELLQLLAEMVCFCADQGISNKCMANVYDVLIHIIHLPLSDKEEDHPSYPETVNLPVERLARIECVLFTFHQLGRRCPQFLTSPGNSETLKNLRVGLQYVSRAVQMRTKHLPSKVEEEKVDSSQHSQQNKSLELMMNNITTLTKDLFHNPPSFKSAVTLSFKAPVTVDKTESSKSSEKRKFTPITFESKVETKKPKFVNTAQQQTKPFEAAHVPRQTANQRGRRGVNGFVPSRRGRLSIIQRQGQGQGFSQSHYSLQASSVQGEFPHMRGQQSQTRGTRINTARTFRGQFNGSKATTANRIYAGGQPPSLMNLRPYRGAFGRTLRGRGRAQVSNVQRRVVLSENVALRQSAPNFRLNW